MLGLVALFSPPTGALFLAAYTFVLMHEFGHCLAAKCCDLEVVSITMTPVGGLAAIADFKHDPKKELLVTFAGPFVNAALIAFLFPFLLMPQLLPAWLGSLVMTAISINVTLFIFNMIPCFPMDGGRILRATLALKYGDLVKGTRIAVSVGKVFAVGFIILGLFTLSIMLVAIGVIMIFLAKAEYTALRQSEAVDMGDLAEQLRAREEPDVR